MIAASLAVLGAGALLAGALAAGLVIALLTIHWEGPWTTGLVR